MKGKDGIAVGIQGKMHFNGDNKYKTVMGGMISIMIYSFMIWYTGLHAYHMTTHHNPHILSLGRAIDYEKDDIATTKVLLNETTKVYYEVIDNQFNR